MDEGAIDWSHFSNGLLVPSVQMRTARSYAYKRAFCRYPILASSRCRGVKLRVHRMRVRSTPSGDSLLQDWVDGLAELRLGRVAELRQVSGSPTHQCTDGDEILVSDRTEIGLP